MPDVLTTAQLAEKLNLTPASLRTYKSKFKDYLIEGQHFVKDENGNNILWTVAGVAQMKALLEKGTKASDASASAEIDCCEPVGTTSKLSVENHRHLALQNLVDNLAEDYVWQQIESELPAAIDRVLARIASRQSSKDQERLARLQSTVLPPLLQTSIHGSLPLLQQSYEAFGGEIPQ